MTYATINDWIGDFRMREIQKRTQTIVVTGFDKKIDGYFKVIIEVNFNDHEGRQAYLKLYSDHFTTWASNNSYLSNDFDEFFMRIDKQMIEQYLNEVL